MMGPITLFGHQETNTMPLTAEQLDHFHEMGWVVVKNMMSQPDVAAIRRDLADVHERFTSADKLPPGVYCSWEADVPAGSPPKVEQLMGSEKVSPTLDRFIRSEAMLDMVEQIIGPDITLYHSKLLMKAPNVGKGHFPWHQDYGYWHHGEKEPTQLNCALAIEPQTRENGCLHYVPRSHKSGLVEHTHFAAQAFAWGLPGDIHAFPGVAVEYGPGDICLFGSLVIHGSEPNRTPHAATFNTCAYDKSGNHKRGQTDPAAILRRPGRSAA